MVQNGQITLYSSIYSPFSHRVQVALNQAKADYTDYVVNLSEKPAWFTEKVNPVGKIPAITYGGPKSAPENPPPESAKINESLVILEFLADLFPEAHLLPADPVLRAQARLFINIFETKVFEAFRNFFFTPDGSSTALLEGLEALQARLAPNGFALGEQWTNADSAVAPFLVRIDLMLKNDIGKFPQSEGLKVLEVYQGPKFARLTKYIEDIRESSLFKGTWDEKLNLEIFRNHPYTQRK
ncbi:thioredoxin-like protein [Cubamyces sp. BRFM 1775]|nr:thioredoxin-like protein [Cubamyces sp. BRFM 1775]